jgi:hypothetical protein
MDTTEFAELHFACITAALGWIAETGQIDALRQFQDECLSRVTSQETLEDWSPSEFPSPLKRLLLELIADQFLTMETDAERHCPIAQFVSQASDRLDPRMAEHLLKFGETKLRFYEVVKREPNRSILLEDLMSGTGRMKVSDSTATLFWERGDIVACRVMEVGGGSHIVGGAVALDAEQRNEILQQLDMAYQEWASELGFGGRPPKSRSEAGILVTELLFAMTVPALWAFMVLEILNEMGRPEVTGFCDPEDEMLLEIYIPVSDMMGALEVLQSMEELEYVPLKAPVWFWYWDREDEDGPLTAAVGLIHTGVMVSGCSKREVASSAFAIASSLGELAGELEVMEAVPWNYASAALPYEDAFRPLQPREEESGVEYRARSHAFFDELFRHALDREIPELSDKAPRKLVGSKTGRKQVVKWLNGLEGKMAKQAGEFDGYDLTWLWAELGLADQRQESLFE